MNTIIYKRRGECKGEQNLETYVYLDESGRKTSSGTIRMTESTYQLGLRIKEIIDEHQLEYKDLSLRKLAEILTEERKFSISHERVRQICQKMNIDKPNAKNGPDAVRTANICPTCNSMMPLIKGTNRPVKLCPACKPKPIDCACTNCGKEFVLTYSQYTIRTSPERGYKGNLYCSKSCFYELQRKKKWWNTSPIYKEYTDNDNKRHLRDIMADYTE